MKWMSVLVLVVLMLGMLGTVAAQEALTPTPLPQGEGQGAISNAADLITLIAGIGLGMIAGGGSVLVVVSRMRHDVVLLTAMERLAASWPAETKELLGNLAWVVGEVTDDVPVTQKPAPSVVDGAAGGK